MLERTNYGGIGVMIDAPSTVVSLCDSERDSVACADASPSETERICQAVARVLTNYRQFAAKSHPLPPCAIEIRRTIPAHSGLGSGTQLALAVAQGLASLAGEVVDVAALARRVGRGRRSAIGIYGFAGGGFLVDGGKTADDEANEEIGQLVAHAHVPAHWRWLLLTPADALGTGLAGQEEIEALERLPPDAARFHRALCRLVLLEMLPALEKSDAAWFCEALDQFGQSVGDYFRPVQGGLYSDARMATLADRLRAAGIRGIAQTSWGPTLAVCVADASRAASLSEHVRTDFKDCRTQIVAPLNCGAAKHIFLDAGAGTARKSDG